MKIRGMLKRITNAEDPFWVRWAVYRYFGQEHRKGGGWSVYKIFPFSRLRLRADSQGDGPLMADAGAIRHRMRLGALAALAGIGIVPSLTTPARADTAFTSFAFLDTGGTQARTDPARWADVINVLSQSGIDPTGVSDSLAAITAAIGVAATKGDAFSKGAAVFFPPGHYVVSGPIRNLVAGRVQLLGANKYSTKITGTFNGFIVDQNTPNTAIDRVENLNISNGQTRTQFDVEVGAIRFNETENGVIHNCFISGWSGVVSSENSFNNMISCCSFSGFGGGQLGNVAIYTNTTSVFDCQGAGFWVAVQCHGTGATPIIGCRFESSHTAIVLGGGIAGQFVTNGATAAGNAVLNFASVPAYITAGMSINDLTTSASIPGGTTVVSTTSTTVTMSANAAGAGVGNGDTILLTKLSDTVTTAGVIGLTTEACDIGIELRNVSGSILAACTITGTHGAPRKVSSLSWSSGGGGVATVTVPATQPLDYFGWDTNSTTRSIEIEGAVPSGFNGTFTGTRTSSTTFTYPLASNPGTYISGDTWFEKQIAGIKGRGSTGCTFLSIACAIAGANIRSDGAAFDFYDDGSDTGALNTCIGMIGGSAGWIMPKGSSKAGWQFINCDQPAGSTTDNAGRAAGMVFADLPGQSSVNMPTAKEGMTYDLLDCNASTFIATAAGGGSGATAHRRVRYNAATPAWQVVG